jgi:RNA polymerase sigma-70 factor, ECF subfamily
LESFCFNEHYLDGLKNKDEAIEAHFVAFFQKPVSLKARRQLRSPDLVEDACQETFRRLFEYFRSGKTLENPERLPAFVNTMCHNITLELIRSQTRHSQIPENMAEPADSRVNIHQEVISQQTKDMVNEILAQLPERDRELLRLASLEEIDKSELRAKFGVNDEYLRVLLHRARTKFHAALMRSRHPDKFRTMGSA